MKADNPAFSGPYKDYLIFGENQVAIYSFGEYATVVWYTAGGRKNNWNAGNAGQ